MGMRTTLDIDDDLLELAQDHADRRHTSIDVAVSALIRHGLIAPVEFERSPITGFPLLPVPPGGGRTVTMEMVKALMDEEDEKYFQ